MAVVGPMRSALTEKSGRDDAPGARFEELSFLRYSEVAIPDPAGVAAVEKTRLEHRRDADSSLQFGRTQKRIKAL
jgi:hypothetical protein